MDIEKLNKEVYEKMTEEEKQMYCADKQDIKKQDEVPDLESLSNALQNDELMKFTASTLRLMFDGEPVNKNPLSEIPTPQMRLYGFSGAFKSAFFDTEEELKEYIKNNDPSFGSTCIIEFLGNVAGRSDVIRTTTKDGRTTLYTAVDEDGYGIYNPERSTYMGKFTWEYNHGDLEEMYSAFRDSGIIFENDIYAKIDERNQHILKLCRESNLFNMGEN